MLRIVIKADGLCEGKGVFFGTVDFETWDEFAARLDEVGAVEFHGIRFWFPKKVKTDVSEGR